MAHSEPIIAILGPTASGKSEVAQKVALKLKGEVVSADSMQIYRYMNIGTAKLSPAERIVPHHLIDILDPGEPFSAQLFQQLSRKILETEITWQFSVEEQDCMCKQHLKICVFQKESKSTIP